MCFCSCGYGYVRAYTANVGVAHLPSATTSEIQLGQAQAGRLQVRSSSLKSCPQVILRADANPSCLPKRRLLETTARLPFRSAFLQFAYPRIRLPPHPTTTDLTSPSITDLTHLTSAQRYTCIHVDISRTSAITRGCMAKCSMA